MDTNSILGFHHVTAICSDAQRNLDFYTGTLGLRLLKVTVNFDDPTAYHLYYGDATGSPGSILTFFPYRQGRRGIVGNGQFNGIILAVPEGSFGFWQTRLHDAGSEPVAKTSGGEPRLEFADPDGLRLALVEAAGADPGTWPEQKLNVQHAITHIYSVQLASKSPSTVEMLSFLGFEEVESGGSAKRFTLKSAIIDLARLDGDGFGGHGGIHHVAFGVADESSQLAWRERLVKEGDHVSPVMDRDYFKSIYFREPGGALFELATLGPGFATDEGPEALGTSLRLPEQYEELRPQILNAVDRLKLPSGVLLGKK